LVIGEGVLIEAIEFLLVFRISSCVLGAGNDRLGWPVAVAVVDGGLVLVLLMLLLLLIGSFEAEAEAEAEIERESGCFCEVVDSFVLRDPIVVIVEVVLEWSRGRRE
jgi:hypothetical protein